MFIAGLLAVPGVLNAQVEKRVEVSKAYVPSVEHATKLAVRPNMVDTAAIQPEIDYSITPLTLETQLATRPIRPATITYWEFDRPLPFYLKAGAGYPLNSALDLYVSTQNPDIGYALHLTLHDIWYSMAGAVRYHIWCPDAFLPIPWPLSSSRLLSRSRQ